MLINTSITGMIHLTAAAWEESLKKEQSKIKELEEKYNSKILENGASIGKLIYFFLIYMAKV